MAHPVDRKTVLNFPCFGSTSMINPNTFVISKLASMEIFADLFKSKVTSGNVISAKTFPGSMDEEAKILVGGSKCP